MPSVGMGFDTLVKSATEAPSSRGATARLAWWIRAITAQAARLPAPTSAWQAVETSSLLPRSVTMEISMQATDALLADSISVGHALQTTTGPSPRGARQSAETAYALDLRLILPVKSRL